MSRDLASISIFLDSVLSNSTDHYCLIPTDLASLFTFFVAILFVVFFSLLPWLSLASLKFAFRQFIRHFLYQPQSSYLYG